MRSPLLVALTSLALLSTGIGCGPGVPPAASAPASTAAAPPSVDGAPATWSASLPKADQVLYMKKNVAPRMAKVFQMASAERYAGFSCVSCHGPEYKDPKDFLPRLTMRDGKMTAFAEKPGVAMFVAQHVVPEMASAMGQPPYDPQTQKGFGCNGCHAVDMR